MYAILVLGKELIKGFHVRHYPRTDSGLWWGKKILRAGRGSMPWSSGQLSIAEKFQHFHMYITMSIND